MPTGPQRLILIQSGSYEYAEIELAGTLQIVGPNNTGKTTLINTLQFLYIDDRGQMNFGSYSPEETREFYFPGQYSYILFECLGVTGQCVVGWRGQSKTSGGDPERFCYSGPFAPADFLDDKNRVREPRDVFGELGARKNLRVLKGPKEHRELLLPPVGSDGRGLGIVALKDPDKYHQFRETLKNLLTLSAITQEQMRDRLLMLADIPPDRTAFDARALFGDDYDLIRARRERLVKFKQNQSKVEKLVSKFDDREKARGELMWRWTDLRGKQQKFNEEHTRTLERSREEAARQDGLKTQADTEIARLHITGKDLSEQKGGLDATLNALAKQEKEFAGFLLEMEQAALKDLGNEIRDLENQLANAEANSRQAAQNKISFFGERVRDKEQTIARFDKLAVTVLRKHFTDDELNLIFRLLNRDLLELPVGEDGIQIADKQELLAVLRALLAGISDGVFRDANVSIPLTSGHTPLSGLENVEAAQLQLVEYQETLQRWKSILSAIEQREKLEAELQRKRGERDGVRDASGREIREGRAKRIHRFEDYQKAKDEEPRLRVELKRITDAIAATSARIEKLEAASGSAATAKARAEDDIRKAENDFNAIMGRFDQCVFPEFSAKTIIAADVPNDFDATISLFLRQQERQKSLGDEIDKLLFALEQALGDEFRGQDDDETIGKLRGELDALVEKEDALARDWNAHLHGLKATFDLVLKNLGHVSSAAGDLNRAFTKVRVSNLKAIKLEVFEQGDLVGWIRRLAQAEQPGLFDDDTSLSATLKNFRAKLEGNPVIRFADLFTLGVTVTGANNRPKTYRDFRQIESHGTTITIKVLFNLLLLKHQLRRDDCAVPFYLDEIEALDDPNREAILRTARQLGFIAITAAPKAVSEVDALYFLQPKNGRIVLRQSHRVQVKRAANSPP